MRLLLLLAAGADVRAGAGNAAGAGVQAKNGDNTKAATATVPERAEREGCEGTRMVGGGGRTPLWIFLIPAHVTL